MLQTALLEQAAMLTENQAENQALSQAENAITTQTDRPELQEADVIDSAQLAAATWRTGTSRGTACSRARCAIQRNGAR